MTSDTPGSEALTGDVIPDRIRRVSGDPGSDDGLIEVPLVGHAHHYRVRVILGANGPRLVELHIIDDDAEIDPDTIRQIPVRRLAKAAATFIRLTEHGIGLPTAYDPTTALRPDHEPPTRRPGRRKQPLDDVHYRQVANLLKMAREVGLPPREYVAERLGASLPSVDRWIREAKRRKFLPRDWAMSRTTTETTATTDKEDDR